MRKVFMILLIGMFLISFASAAELLTFDNVKVYYPDIQKVKVENTFGLGRTIAEIKLDTPLNVEVPIGYQKVAQFTVYNYDDEYNEPLKNIDAYNLDEYNLKEEKAIKIDRNFDYKLLNYKDIIVDDYETVCEVLKNTTKICNDVLVGNHIKQKEEWIDFDYTKLTKGNYSIGLFTKLTLVKRPIV